MKIAGGIDSRAASLLSSVLARRIPSKRPRRFNGQIRMGGASMKLVTTTSDLVPYFDDRSIADRKSVV